MVADIKGFGWCGTGQVRRAMQAQPVFTDAVQRLQSRLTCDIDMIDAVDASSIQAKGMGLGLSLKTSSKTYPLEAVKERVEELLKSLGFADVTVAVAPAPAKPAPEQQRPGSIDSGRRVVTQAMSIDPVTGAVRKF